MTRLETLAWYVLRPLYIALAILVVLTFGLLVATVDVASYLGRLARRVRP